MLQQVELSCGLVDYVDTGGPGPVVMLLHGLVMNHSLWREVSQELAPDVRCIIPTLPVGAHRHPVRSGYRLTPNGVAELIGELIEVLGLTEVTLVENDTGRAQMYAATLPERVSQLVLVACEAFDNYPPGLPGRMLGQIARIPGGIWLVAQAMRSTALQRSSLSFGAMTKRGVPHDMAKSWFEPLITSPAIRADLAAYCRAVSPDDMQRTALALQSFDRPALVIWAKGDRMMPQDHGRRLTELMPNARLIEIEDSRTLIPIDQPHVLAMHLHMFLTDGRNT